MLTVQLTLFAVLLFVAVGSGMKCGEAPLIYVGNEYADTYEFWIDTVISMKSNHCPRQLGSIGWLLDCFFMDTDYKDLEYHLWYICQYYGMLRPHSMRSLIQNYCFTHRYEALAAYQCTTGCPLADHINQICMRMFTPRAGRTPTETRPETTTTPNAVLAPTTPSPTTTPPGTTPTTSTAPVSAATTPPPVTSTLPGN